MTINKFRGKYEFLSNFYSAPVLFDGITYPNNECAFQAQKTLDKKAKAEFALVSASEAKKRGRHVILRLDWEQTKDNLMYEIVKAKFQQNENLLKQLISTSDAYLEEGNTWNDTYWGRVNGAGKNMLGKILMGVRTELTSEKAE